MFLLAIVCLFLVAQVSCFPTFMNRIPNGHNVQEKGSAWPAVGHTKTNGGPHNQFGDDFEAAGNRWTTSLCQKDSDGDGITNGAELGDPTCTWKEGQTPSRTTAITHPGIPTSKRTLSRSGQTAAL